jgi:hypothetical protein
LSPVAAGVSGKGFDSLFAESDGADETSSAVVLVADEGVELALVSAICCVAACGVPAGAV